MGKSKLTDEQKKKIIKDYVSNNNKTLTAKMNKVSISTITRVCDSDPTTVKKVEAKKEKNTLSLLETMDNTKGKRMELMDSLIDAMADKTKNLDLFTSVKDLATVYGIMVDKDLKFAEMQKYKNDVEDRFMKYIPARDIAKCFADINRSIDDREYREYWLEGGRGSTKSSFVSEKIIELLENDEKKCAVVLRKVKDTIKDSVHAQLEWALELLSETYPNIKEDWKITKSPLEMTKMSTGQKIFFRGADDYGKIKSLKPPKDKYIGVVWYEEFDQFAGMTEIRKINQSLIRGGEDFVLFYSYNTPISSRHFVNKEKIIAKDTRLVNRSDYRDVPPKWLGRAFIDEAEYMKSINKQIYDNEYLGEMTGTGDNVFNNIQLRDITDEEIAIFDNNLHGIDWGYYPDPFAYNDMHYDSSQRTLYIYFELEEHKKGNLALQELLLANGVYKDYRITADSNEPKSIGDFRMWGWNMRGAEKGPGSVDYGFKWLQSLNKIVIDNRRCPKTADEFSLYEYDKDKDGNLITGYPDGQNDHHIADVRYATEKIWKKRGK